MTETLFPYQIEGQQWLAPRKAALLADEMGLGKSAQAIAAFGSIFDATSVAILCPAVGRINWKREFEKFSNSPPIFDIISSTTDYRTPGRSLICSYSLATKLAYQWTERFDVLILDEVHELKNPLASRTQAIFGANGLVHRANRVWVLSGTPAQNHAGELWVILYTFGVTKLKYDDFVERYCHTYAAGYGRIQITGTKTERIPEIKNMLSKVMLRRKKEDVMKQLPPIQYAHITVEAGEVDLEVESSFIQYVFPVDRRGELNEKLLTEKKMIEGIAAQAGLGADGMAALEALAQSVSTLRRYTGLQKVKTCAELVAGELEMGLYDKIVIFAIHRDVIEGLRNNLRKFKPVTLYGGHDDEKKQRNIDSFQKNPKTRVFIGNIQACGTTVTLTAAHNVLFVEQDWTPGRNAQAAMRVHRIGQTKNVFVRFAALANSIDERVVQVLKRKTKELSAMFDDPLPLNESGRADFPLQNAKDAGNPFS